MKHYCMCFLVVILVGISVSPGITYAYEESRSLLFSRDLSYGERSYEVKRLQEALNSVKGVNVAAFGPGSLGNETSFFGPLTRQAVIRFQERYARDVLSPIGLSRGTGYVGPLTRRKLQEIVGDTPNEEPFENVPASYERGNTGVDIYKRNREIEAFREQIMSVIETGEQEREIDEDDLPEESEIDGYLIRSLSSERASPGDEVVISSYIPHEEESDTYTVHIGTDYHIPHITGKRGDIAFTVPSLPSGSYDIAFSGSDGVHVSDTRELVIE